MIGCLRTRVRKQPIIVLYLKFENELKFYNLRARCLKEMPYNMFDGAFTLVFAISTKSHTLLI